MEELVDPVLRHGLVGLCGLQLGVGVWLVRLSLAMARDLTRVVEANTAAVQTLARRADDRDAVLVDIRDRLIARPCQHAG